MCCLTIVKTNSKKIVITHNRDEHWSRQITDGCVKPSSLQGRKIWMPKDKISAGTWIGTDGYRAAAILNGFKHNHTKKKNYMASRGTIIPRFFSAVNTDDFIRTFDPAGLEPFTLLLIDVAGTYIEFGWDDKDVHLAYHNCETPAMYSSSTLYSQQIKDRRKITFHSILNPETDSIALWKFHEKKGHDHGNFLNVDFNNGISTVAISQIVLGNTSEFTYQSINSNIGQQTILLT